MQGAKTYRLVVLVHPKKLEIEANSSNGKSITPGADSSQP